MTGFQPGLATTEELRTVLNEIISAARVDKPTIVDFVTDLHTRTNKVRDLILDYGFGGPAKAEAAGVGLGPATPGIFPCLSGSIIGRAPPVALALRNRTLPLHIPSRGT